jgi:hypothetical protein
MELTIIYWQVSRQCHRLTHEKTVWVNAYRKSTILRPPGPFPSQSAGHLEQTLKKSIDLYANWTSPSPRPVSRRTLDLRNDTEVKDMKLLLGRYLLVKGDLQLRCYDLDSVVDGGEGVAIRLIASYDMSAYAGYFYQIILNDFVDGTDVYESPLPVVCALAPYSKPNEPIFTATTVIL